MLNPLETHPAVRLAANFNNPGALNTGALPSLFPDGQVKYFELDLRGMTTRFSRDITLPLSPFQGTLGLPRRPAPWRRAPMPAGVFSWVRRGRMPATIDLRELHVGNRLFIPVRQSGAKIFTAIPCAAGRRGGQPRPPSKRAVRLLHPGLPAQARQPAAPVAETDSHWIVLGFDPDLSLAFRSCLVDAIDFLSLRAG